MYNAGQVLSSELNDFKSQISMARIQYYVGQKTYRQYKTTLFRLVGRYIEADSIRENDESFYLVKIQVTNRVVDKRNERPLEIIPGMTADVDILTGKKTIMNYILKPIFKSADGALSER